MKSIKINFLMNIVLTMSTFIFPLVTFPYVSRVLGPVGTGKVSFATSVISYFLLFAQLGIPTYGIRACAEVRDDREKLTRVTHELLIISLVTTIFSYVALFIAVMAIPKLHEEKLLLYLIGSSIILTTIGIEWLYRALEQYVYITIRSLIFKAISIVAMFLLVRSQDDYVAYGLITVIASSASFILNFINAHKYIGFSSVGKYNFKRHWKPIAVFFAMACATTIYTHLDVVMLGFMKTDADVGYYNAAVKIKTILVSVVTSLGTVILPRVSYYVSHGQKEEFERVCKKALGFVFLSAFPLTVYFILFAKEGIFFLSGEAFAGSIIPMQVIMPTVLLIGVTNIMGIQILIPTGREIIVMYSAIAGAVVDFCINAVLIPRMASTGAAIGTVVAEGIVLLVQYYYLKGEIKNLFSSIHIGRLIIGTLLASVASLWVVLLNRGYLFTLITSAFFFFGVYCLFMLLRKEKIMQEVFETLLRKISLKK